MHTIILPPRISKTLKPSIADAQKDMMIHLVNINDLKKAEEDLKAIAINEKLTIQPKLFVVGETLKSLKEFYVYLEGTIYKTESLLKAIDLIIKACFVFNLEYSQKSRYVWIFLQEILYGIKSKEQIPKIRNITAKLINACI